MLYAGVSMINLQFDTQKDSPLKILCLGAHSDDIEIGCGGTILKMTKEYPNSEVYWVVFSADGKRKKEAEESTNIFLKDAKEKAIVIKDFRDGFFPYIGAEIKEYFETLKHEVDPDVIFTHYRCDLHQDHRQVSDITWNTFRDHLILEYEIPKYDGDLGPPNFFVHLEDDICETKIQNIFNIFKTQTANQWFRKETFQSIMTLRGIESNSPSGYAEAFYCRKIII